MTFPESISTKVNEVLTGVVWPVDGPNIKERVEAALLAIAKEAYEDAALIADKLASCNCHEAYKGRKLHEPNAAHIDCEDIAYDIRSRANELEK